MGSSLRFVVLPSRPIGSLAELPTSLVRMVRGACGSSHSDVAFHIFEEMDMRQVHPDRFTFNAMLSAAGVPRTEVNENIGDSPGIRLIASLAAQLC
eukprot:Skav221874  [mRNA]  locus=scaffold1395:225451:229238:+ [translate_table: standard]